MEIGRIVASTAHNNYVCRIDPKWETETLDLDDYLSLGDFIRIQHATLGSVVGFVHDTQVTSLGSIFLVDHFNPNFLHHAYYENGSLTFIKILIIGQIDKEGQPKQGVPLAIIPNGSIVELLSDEDTRLFHLRQGKLHLNYLPYLKMLNPPLLFHLLKLIKETLEFLIPEQKEAITFLQMPYLWKDYF